MGSIGMLISIVLGFISIFVSAYAFAQSKYLDNEDIIFAGIASVLIGLMVTVICFAWFITVPILLFIASICLFIYRLNNGKFPWS